MEKWSSKLELKRSNIIQKTSYKGVERASKPSNKVMKRLKAEAGEEMVRLEAKIKLIQSYIYTETQTMET